MEPSVVDPDILREAAFGDFLPFGKRCYAEGTMSYQSAIEWRMRREPRVGLREGEPGCKHCYAETFAERSRGLPDHPYGQGFDLRLVPESSKNRAMA